MPPGITAAAMRKLEREDPVSGLFIHVGEDIGGLMRQVARVSKDFSLGLKTLEEAMAGISNLLHKIHLVQQRKREERGYLSNSKRPREAPYSNSRSN